MKPITLLVALFTFVISANADFKKIQGAWKASSGQIGGKDLPKALLEKMVLVIKDETYDYDEGHGHDVGLLKSVKDLKEGMDIVGTKGPNKGKIYLTIFKLDGKNLVILYGLDGKRPKSFDDKGKMVMTMVYKKSE